MRKLEINKKLFIFACIFSSFLFPLYSESTKSEIPLSGKTLKSFVPKGWKILTEAQGDLNKDTVTDAALVLVSQSESKKKSTDRILLVLLGDSKKGYVLQSYSKRAIMKLNEGGASGDPFSGISIEKGKLIVSHNGGNRLQWGYTHTFEFRNNNLFLISKAITEVHVNSARSLDMKVNMVSGRVLRKETDRNGEKKVKAYKEISKPLTSLKEFAPYE